MFACSVRPWPFSLLLWICFGTGRIYNRIDEYMLDSCFMQLCADWARSVIIGIKWPSIYTPDVPVWFQGRYYEAVCTAIDPVNKEVTACFPTADKTSCAESFKLHYDILVMGVSGTGWFRVEFLWQLKGEWCIADCKLAGSESTTCKSLAVDIIFALVSLAMFVACCCWCRCRLAA